jgi:hypothetical protein
MRLGWYCWYCCRYVYYELDIASFILFSRHFRFLAATTNPFLRYCINNFVIPAAFLFFILLKPAVYQVQRTYPYCRIFNVSRWFFVGLNINTIYFFYLFFQSRSFYLPENDASDKKPKDYIRHLKPGELPPSESKIIKVEWYLETPMSVKKTRDVSHYTRDFIENIFKRHHFAAVLSVFAAFLFLIGIGFLQDSLFFKYLLRQVSPFSLLYLLEWRGHSPIFYKAGAFLTSWV